MHNGAVGNAGAFANRYRRARLGVDDHAVLNVGVRADDDGVHLSGCIDFIGANDRVGADEHIGVHHHFAAQNGGGIDKRIRVNLRQVAAGVLSDHLWNVF